MTYESIKRDIDEGRIDSCRAIAVLMRHESGKDQTEAFNYLKEHLANKEGSAMEPSVHRDYPGGTSAPYYDADARMTGMVRPTTKQYGHWLPFDPIDISTLGAALGALWAQIEYTIKRHGQPKGLKWIVKDWKTELIVVPDEIDNIALPPGYTCTIGWKAWFDGAEK